MHTAAMIWFNFKRLDYMVFKENFDDAISYFDICSSFVLTGALMHLEVPRAKFLLAIFEKLVVKYLSASQGENIVQAYVGVTGLNDSFVHLQAVFTDHEDASKSITVAKEFESFLKEDMENGNIYSIYKFNAHYSGIAYSGYSGETLLLLFFLLVLLSVFMYGVMMIFIKANRAPRSEAFTFARFENCPENEGRVDMTVESHPKLSVSKSTQSISTESSVVTLSPSSSPLDERPSLEYIRKQWRRLSTFSQNFINPLFGNAAAEDFSSSVNLSALTKDSRTEDNPFYKTAQEQGLTDEDMSSSLEIQCPNNPVDMSTENNDRGSDVNKVKTLDTGLVQSMLALSPIAEEQLEDVSLEGSCESIPEAPKIVAPQAKSTGSNRCRAKNGKGLFKQILLGGKNEDGMNLVENDEKDE
ncbi:hypothetical protein QYM36_007475 [Artemia franciscana]|uniref:Uncharacterized protein n=1 Tax=Artemia franciscana TaxID=6661 RepID=A0AA88IG80_ARTSF|nr:hypothetical protein QYM36_007475 [Artemia franciscana]